MDQLVSIPRKCPAHHHRHILRIYNLILILIGQPRSRWTTRDRRIQIFRIIRDLQQDGRLRRCYRLLRGLIILRYQCRRRWRLQLRVIPLRLRQRCRHRRHIRPRQRILLPWYPKLRVFLLLRYRVPHSYNRPEIFHHPRLCSSNQRVFHLLQVWLHLQHT